MKICRSLPTIQTMMTIHANEKPYSCSSCIKGFNQNSNLAVHQKNYCKESAPEENNPVRQEVIPSNKNLSVTRIPQDPTCLPDCNQTTTNNNQLFSKTNEGNSNNKLMHQDLSTKEPQTDKIFLEENPEGGLQIDQVKKNLDNKPGTRMGEKEPPVFKIPNPYDPSKTSTDDSSNVDEEPTPNHDQVMHPIPKSDVNEELEKIIAKDSLNPDPLPENDLASETNGPEDAAPDAEVPEYGIVRDQTGLEDRE